MTAVLQFEQRDRASRAAALPLKPAEIIIFPGVRFERLDSCDAHILPEDGKPNGRGPMQQRAAR
jgi:hypothetical protein